MFPTLCKLENLFKTEVLSMTNLHGYVSQADVTEWFLKLPSHIKKEKIIAVTNINQNYLFEYCNLDLADNCVRVGEKGNNTHVPLSSVQVLIAYFT